jgi:hypothetical protein
LIFSISDGTARTYTPRHSRSRDSQWDHGQALETPCKRGARDTEEIGEARNSSKRGVRDTEEIEEACNSSKGGARDTEEIEGARESSKRRGARKRSREIQLFMVRLSTPQLEGTESDALAAKMIRLYPETFEPPTGVPRRRPHDLQIRLREGGKPFHTTPYRVMPLEDSDEEMQRHLRVLADCHGVVPDIGCG